MKYVRAKVSDDEEQRSSRSYIADTQMMIAKNTARFAGGNYMSTRWAELFETKPDTRTGSEIVAEVMRGAGLRLSDD